jgi:hypothetical protein
MGEAGRSRADRLFSLDAMRRQYQAVYEAVVAGH